ncbi:hypothetical protein A0J61_06960 [Choanephora cucurbitarum]|uniref:Major facilitator superfamily (MFS) profile domain-containing protein n=1 Tax=Choanephora cucurbitarum TaxID=101091 RepID=A0A1C7N8Q7_9FUNG|nr:hypothetical protein A0J61_06960 [Choanephora cucurbitarum]
MQLKSKAPLSTREPASICRKSYQAIEGIQEARERKEDIPVVANEYVDDEEFQWTEHEEEQVLSILDSNLMPFILLMTFVLNMDRTNLCRKANAISDNLANDLGFTNDGVNMGISVYHFVFTLFTFPSNAISKSVGPHHWIPVLMTSWAVVTWAHALIHDFNGFMTVRTLIAITEAGFIPACLSYMSLWYKTQELATRLAWFWASQALASSVSGMISFGVFRMRGIYGLEGWKWLFIVDGVATHIVGLIAFLYLPSSPSQTHGKLRGSDGWLTKRQIRIAIQRIVRDDATKKEHQNPITKQDVCNALGDFNLWVHLLITFLGMMPNTPIQNYLPSIIKEAGFSTTTANLLTAPSYIIGLILSIIIAQSSDKRGHVATHALIGSTWALAGFALLEYLPDDVGRWPLYFSALFTASSPSWHGMQIAWMSSNLAPFGKRTLALAAVIAAANINGVPGSQIYQASDAPRFRQGNKINMALCVITILLFLFQKTRYKLINKQRKVVWNNMSSLEQKEYIQENKDIGNYGLHF